MVATNTVNLNLLDSEMNLTPKSDDEEGFGPMQLMGSARSNANDDDEEDDIDDEENDDDDNEEDDSTDDDNENNDEDDNEDDEEDNEEEDEEEDDDEDYIPTPIETDSYASNRGSKYEKIKPSDDTWTAPPRNVGQPSQIPPVNVQTGQIQQFNAPIPKDFTSQMLAREFARANYGERQDPLTFDYLQRTYGDFNPGRQQMQQQARDGGSLPKAGYGWGEL